MRLHHVRRGSGEPLVLLHGVGDTHRTWANVVGRLARAHEVIALDLPGFGASPSLRGAAPSPRALAGAVAGFMGDGAFHVAGNSLGGGVALEIALMRRARSVTALSPIGFARGWERAWLDVSLRATKVIASHLPRAALERATVRRAITLQAMRRPMRAPTLVRTLDELKLAPAFDATRSELVAYDFAGDPACPVTVAWGEHDRLLLPRQAERARRALPDARHLALRGCGHLPMWDDPEQVASAILETTARGG